MCKKILLFLIFHCLGFQALSFQDPTAGKSFFPWLWQDQFKPTLENSITPSNLSILMAGALTTVAAHQYDEEVYQHNLTRSNRLMNSETSSSLAALGGGVLGLGIVTTQIFFDQSNGLMHARAVVMTSTTHFLTALIVQRKRPGDRWDYLPFPSSFPSGHASSAFATATALSYAYGWKAGAPAFIVASAIAASRVNENAHWVSDVTAGAALGIFWGRASYLAQIENEKTEKMSWLILPYQDGLQLNARIEF